MSTSEHHGCSCEDDGHIGVPHEDAVRLTDEQRKRLADHRSAFSFETNDRQVERQEYTEGRYVRQSMRRSNRSHKEEKHWRTSQAERSVLRYTTG